MIPKFTAETLGALGRLYVPDGWSLEDYSRALDRDAWRFTFRTPVKGSEWCLVDVDTYRLEAAENPAHVVREAIEKAERNVKRRAAGIPKIGEWHDGGPAYVTHIDAGLHTATLSDGRVLNWQELRL